MHLVVGYSFAMFVEVPCHARKAIELLRCALDSRPGDRGPIVENSFMLMSSP